MMRIAALPLLLALVAAPAVAVEPFPTGRYAFVPAERGTLRLDTATGAVSLCAGDAGNLACTLLPDDAGDHAAAADGLGDRIAALEARVAALEVKLRDTDAALTDAEAMDKVMALSDRMMRQFFAMVRDMKGEIERKDP
jgi:hypothetical protein